MNDQTTMTMTPPDGTTTGPFTASDLKEAAARLTGSPPMKDDPDFRKHNQRAFDVTAGELRQFIDRALETSGGVAVILRTAFLEGTARYARLFHVKPPTDVLQFSERVPMWKGRLTETRAAALWFLMSSAVYAAGDAPGANLWPPEPEYAATVIELETLGPAMFATPRCDLKPCGDWYQRKPSPAPVPLPPTLLLLTAAIAALIWKVKRYDPS